MDEHAGCSRPIDVARVGVLDHLAGPGRTASGAREPIERPVRVMAPQVMSLGRVGRKDPHERRIGARWRGIHCWPGA